ncbi:MAG: hypothetical protein LBU28_07180 [Spirochaetaceae bacterium]|nr:hypothetical protein [Spirochaetaceae bacterium]
MENANETAVPPSGAGLTFEKVWVGLMELRESQKETDRIVRENAEAMKELRESQKETDRIVRENAEAMKELRESQKETDRQMKKTDKRLGDQGRRFGEVVEHMVLPNLLKRFGDLGFTFTKAGPAKITDPEHNLFMEIDAFMENGDTVMIVEIKTTPSRSDVDAHIKRMKKLRIYADLRQDRRAYLGAIAGVVFVGEAKDYAIENGFYVLEPSGKTFAITEPASQGFAARKW